MGALDDMLNQHAAGVQIRRVAGEYQQAIDRLEVKNQKLEKDLERANSLIAQWQALCFSVQAQLSRHEPKNPVLVDKDLRQRIASAGARAFDLVSSTGGAESRYVAAREAGATFAIPESFSVPAVQLRKDLTVARNFADELAGRLHRISWACQLDPQIKPLLDQGLARVEQLHAEGKAFVDISLFDTRSGFTFSYSGLYSKGLISMDGVAELRQDFDKQILQITGTQNYLYAQLPPSMRPAVQPQFPTKVTLGPGARPRTVSSVKVVNQAPAAPLDPRYSVTLGPGARGGVATAQGDNAQLRAQVSGKAVTGVDGVAEQNLPEVGQS